MATTEYPLLVLLLFFHAILLFHHSCSAQIDNCPIVIQIGRSGTSGAGRGINGDNQHYTFTDLGMALDSLEFQSGNDTVCIDLTPGEHVLGYSQRVIDRDVVISGGGPQEVTIVYCSASEGNRFESGYDEFPLRFGNESRVMVRGIRFEKCARPLLFNETRNVTLEDCSFSSFTQSAVEIYNTPYVTISNCFFTNNTSLGIGTIPYSGNAGALSIGFGETFPNTTQPEVLIQDSVFDRNEANVRGECILENTILSTSVYTQRGGGVACYFGAAGLEINLLVERCTFVNNRAQDSGGGLYINLSGAKGAATNVTVRESNFSGNYATMDGGGLEVTFDTAESVHFPSFLVVQDCHFTHNRAKYGGAFKTVQISSQGNLNRIHIERNVFQQNRAEGGAVLHMQSFYAGVGLSHHAELNTSRIAVEDCTFTENTGKRSVVFISNNQVNFTGVNQFIGNTGSSIRVSGTLLSLSGQLQFIGNQNHDDGPSGILYVTSFAQVLLNPGVNISFVNNTGRDGGAIVVKSSRVSSGFAKTLYNPQCFLQFSESQVAPIEWANYNVSLVFQGNRAIFAPVMYISSLDACSWFNNSGRYFTINITETWSFMRAEQNYIFGSESTDPSTDRPTDLLTDRPELYIQTDVNDLTVDIPSQSSVQCQGINNTNVCAYPGQDIQLNIRALDQFSHITYGFVQIATQPEQNTSIEFIPTIVHATASGDPVDFRYNSSEAFGPIDVKLETPFSVTEVSRTFTLSYIGCLPGFNLSMDRYQCECEKRHEVLSCDPNKQFVLLREGLWGAPPNWSRSLVTYRCPANYCNCTGIAGERSIEGCALIFTNASLSCNPNRAGVLCGECRESYGVGMLTMECRKFTASFNMYYWLLPLLVLFIVVVAVVVVKVGVAIPALLLGPLFYIQVSPTGVSQLNDSFKLFPAVMDCIESTLALYVPYDFSLHQELTALESYGLRYISPLLTLVVVPIAMRIKYDTRSWYGVWTLLLLMYAMAVETSASLLFCPTLINASNRSISITVWFFDGSVSCYSGGHLGLTILAVLFMVVGILFIAPVAIIAYQKEISKKLSFLDRRHFELISLAFTHPYKDIHRWWAPFELVRRYVFIVAVIFMPGYLTVSLSLASGIMAIQWFIQPYKDRMANIAEAFCLTVLVIVLCIGDTNDFVYLAMGHYFILWPLFYLPAVVAFVCLCVVIGREIWKASKSFKAWQKKRIKLKKKESRDVPSSVSFHSVPNVEVDGTYRTLTTVVSIHEFEDD